MLIEIKEQDFNQYIADHDVCLVTIVGHGCGGCRIQKTQLQHVIDKRPDLSIATLNYSDSGRIAEQFNVSKIPTSLLFKGGVIQKTFDKCTRGSEIEAAMDELN